MKTCLIAVILFITSSVNIVFAQHYIPVDKSSTVQFKVSHQMIFKSTVTGTFSGLKGNIIFDLSNLGQSSFDVSLASATFSSGIGMRDNDLKSEKYLDVQKYPLITVKSEKITKGPKDDNYNFSGTLTMKGITKNISFPFIVKSSNGGYKFTGSFQLNRLDYNIGPDNSIDKNVEVDLSVFSND